MPMLFALMIQPTSLLDALVKLVLLTLVMHRMSSARVSSSFFEKNKHGISILVDSCLVNNGGCHIFADCTHNAISNAVECTCKKGYTNTGCNCHAFCIGEWANQPSSCELVYIWRWSITSLQTAAKWRMADVMWMLFVHTILPPMKLYALAKPDIRTQAQQRMLPVQVIGWTDNRTMHLYCRLKISICIHSF